MRYKSATVTQASGKLGGMAARPDRRGATLRALSHRTRSRGVRTRSPSAAFRVLVGRWASALTAQQRERWSVYGTLVPSTNALGDRRPLDGLRAYLRGNLPRIPIGEPIVDDAPDDLSLPELRITRLRGVSVGIVDFFTSTASPWLGDPNAYVIAHVSAPFSIGRRTPPAPRAAATPIPGDSSALTSGLLRITLPVDVPLGTAQALSLTVIRPDGAAWYGPLRKYTHT